MLPPHRIHLDSPIDEAFERILTLNLDGLPIVDGDDRVIGFFDIAEILVAWEKLVERQDA